mmetsp:Transcript_5559/g.10976  ORF Transcript_5559/g.10976 Transcript_5559/m.10976 type:complete len:748 (-) Transcript_5559:193-2436(-)
MIWGIVKHFHIPVTLSAAILLAICAGLCISAGSGGGGLYVPLIIALLGKDVHTATSVSQCLIFGASFAGVVYDLFQRHPERQRPLIDLSIILYLAPIMMAGALVGSTVSRTLPPSLVMLMLVIACSLAAYKSLRKGVRLWITERGMDMDVMDTMEPIDPVSLITCHKEIQTKNDSTDNSRQSPSDTPTANPFKAPVIPAHDHVVPTPLKRIKIQKAMKALEEAESRADPMKLAVRKEWEGGERSASATDMIYYKKLRDLRRSKTGSNKPFEVMGIHRISFWNPKCNCVFSTFRDQDFIQVFQFLSKKELFSCRAVCLRWHFLSHAKDLQDRFGNLKRTVSYSVIWNPETPTQLPWAPKPRILETLNEEGPLQLGPSQANQIDDVLCEPCPDPTESTPLFSQQKKAQNKKPAIPRHSVANKTLVRHRLGTPLARSRTAKMSAKVLYLPSNPKTQDNPKNNTQPCAKGIIGDLVDVIIQPDSKAYGGNQMCLLMKQQNMIKEAREKSREIIEREQTISLTQAAKLVGIWLITFILIVVRGGKGTTSILNVEYCGKVYWSVTFSAIIVLMAVAGFAGRDLYMMHKQKIDCHYPFAKGDPHWNQSYLLRMLAITFATGVAAGILGVGGGMFLSPVLFEMGMLPLVVAAISTTCILLSSSVLTVLIIVQGIVEISEVSQYVVATVIGAVIGKFFVKEMVSRFRSSAIIPIILGLVIFLSMFVATHQNATKLIAQIESGTVQGFKGVCEIASK